MEKNLIEYIRNSKKKTPVKVYVKDYHLQECGDIKVFGNVLIGDLDEVLKFLNDHKIIDYYLEADRRNSAIPMLDISRLNARIEPGSMIREYVNIGNRAVIMMGAIINIGASIGDDTMIDMGTVIGAKAIIGKRCHIGAGSVIAGVIEPPSANPVVIEDDVVIGANAVVIEGVHIGKGAVIGAGSIVTENVEENSVVVGNPARVIKQFKNKDTIRKTKLVDDLRKL